MKMFELLVLAAIWGASFLFMRIATPELGAIALIACRVGIATLLLLPVLRTREARRQLRSRAVPIFIVGLSNSALPFCLLAWSTLYVNAGFDSVLNATTPLWTAVIAWLGFGIRMTRVQAVGLLLGLAGVLILVHDKLSTGAAAIPLAIGAALIATLSYGFAANYSKRHLAGISPFVLAFGSQAAATLVLLPLAALFWPAHPVAASTWACVVALGVVCTGIAYVLFFHLIEHVGAAYATSVTFLIPVFGMVWGALFLGERVSASMLAGCVVVLFGTAVASGKLGRLTLLSRPAPD
jgi:drug/metabolite transporter (DMT)-like permease